MAERMPDKFHALATYNSEVARGIVHTAEWDDRMAALQAEFDQWQYLAGTSDEDRIRDAMTEAHDHPGRTITR
jgi:hypothetical protein